MTQPGSILQQSRSGWHIVAATADPSESQMVHGPGTVDASWLAKSAAEFVANHGLSQNVALAIDSNATLTAKLTVANAAELRDRRAMSYKVEELLPVAAEDFEADYITDGKHVLGIAAPIRELLPVVTALEEHGLQIHSISPTAVFAIQSFLSEHGNSTHGKSKHDYIVWQDEDRLELFQLSRRIGDWRHLPAESTALVQQFSAILFRAGGPVRVALLDVDDRLHDELQAMPQVEVQVVASRSLVDHAQRGATAALTGKSKPWVELRRDKLVTGDPYQAFRRETQWCYWALALLLMSAAFFFWMRSQQYATQVATIQGQQEALFKQAFPSGRVPNAVLSRLKSERSKLLGARGNDAAIEQPPSALNVLHELVMGMPAELRLQVQQLRIEDGKVYLDVNVRSVGDAGDLASQLEQHGFEIEPPTTEQYDAQQVSVRISGKLPSQPSGSGQ